MNNAPNPPLTNNTNPNKKKTCDCEDKYGPKPFSTNQPASNKPTN